MFEGRLRNYEQYSDWILLILVIAVIAGIYAYYIKPKLFLRIVYSGFNKNESEKLRLERNKLNNRISFFLNNIFIINLSIFVFLIFQTLEIETNINSPLKLLAFIFLIITAYYLVRNLLYYIAGHLTDSTEIHLNFLSLWMSLNKAYGLILFPCLFFLLYIDNLITGKIIIGFCLVLFSFLFIYKLLSGIKIASEKRVSAINIFLYLCTLEFIPVSALIKHGAGMI